MNAFNLIKKYIIAELMPYLDNSTNFEEFNLLANGLDSLKIMLLINFIEETFNVNIPDELSQPSNFSTITDILELLSQVSKKTIQTGQP